MFGVSYAGKVEEQSKLPGELGVAPVGGEPHAIDPGCGSGFQSVALADLDFRVTALDSRRFVLSFRDLASSELAGLDRFLFLQGDENHVMTCFPEYLSPEIVMVHDLVHLKDGAGNWTLQKSCYPKLRLSLDWVTGLWRPQDSALKSAAAAGWQPLPLP
jgi:hypothetical protein